MTPMFSVALVLLLLTAAGAGGCVDRNRGAAGRDLESFSKCTERYPDQQRVSCEDSIIVPYSPSRRPGLTCLEEISTPGHITLRVWGRSDGKVDLEFNILDRPAPQEFFGWADLTLGAERKKVHFAGNSVGGVVSVDFQPVDEREFSGRFAIYSMDVSGTPAFLSDESMTIRATEFNGRAWYVWEFANSAKPYWFSSMAPIVVGQTTEWVPSSLSNAGADFSVDGMLTKYMIADLRNWLPTPFPSGQSDQC